MCINRARYWSWLCVLLVLGCARAGRDPAAEQQLSPAATPSVASAPASSAKTPAPVTADEAVPPAAVGPAPTRAAPVTPGAPKSAAPSREQLPEKKKDSAGDLDKGMGRGASGLPGTKSGEDDVDAEGLFVELSASFDRLELALSAPDCTTAAVFRDRVCELSERICRLADEHPSSSAAEHCGDGRARCSDARRKFASGCPTP